MAGGGGRVRRAGGAGGTKKPGVHGSGRGDPVREVPESHTYMYLDLDLVPVGMLQCIYDFSCSTVLRVNHMTLATNSFR